ncbi:MAG: IS1380 family transposase, partial [Alloprevotella sp.]|nr:IS1380 family transposase [Alloprevotella sp.]
MAKIQIKSEKITPFGGIFHVRELFSCFVGPVVDKVLGLRCTSYGYQYSEIVGTLSSVYFCGGDCVED